MFRLILIFSTSVAGPHNLDADPDADLACHFDADPDPTFHFEADPDPAPSFQIKVQIGSHFVHFLLSSAN
jgi:hypothetical protein